jgi:arylsulfatase A-like enzyme
MKRNFSLALLPALALFPALGLLHAATPAASKPPGVSLSKPNVVVMVVDDLGWGDVSCLTHGAVKTPNIDRLAQTGVKFTSGYVTAPLCGPSRAGLFSGVYGQRFGFVDNGGGIPVTQPLLPGVLRNAGYRTALIGKWHSTGPMPHARGCFDETLCSPVSSPFIDYHHPKVARDGKVEESDEYSTDLFAREAVAFIERNQAQPFSLTVTFNAPHEALYFSMSGFGAVRQGPWKLLLSPDGTPALFDLSKDIGEKHDLAVTESTRVKALTGIWKAWHAQMPPPAQPLGKTKKSQGKQLD